MKVLISESQLAKIQESFGTYKDIPEDEMNRIKNSAQREYEEIMANKPSKDDLMAKLEQINSILDDPSNDPQMAQLGTPNEKQKYYKELELEFDRIKNEILTYKEESFQSILRKKLNQYLYQKRIERINKKNQINEDDLKTIIEDVIGSSNYERFFNFDISLFHEKLIDKIYVEEKELSVAISEFLFEGGEVTFLIGEFKPGIHIDDSGQEKNWKWETKYMVDVSMDNILDAINLMKEHFPNAYQDIIKEVSDINDHNLFFQFMLFKEIKYR